MKPHTILLAIAGSSLSACTSTFWYNQVQFAQYDKCEKLSSPEDRRRCKEETYPDKDKYDKDREATRGASK